MPEQPKNRPNPQEAVARAKAAAAPKVAKAMESAGPAVEKAAAGAGKLFGTLRERAKETARSFTDAYGSDEEDAASPASGSRPNTATGGTAPASTQAAQPPQAQEPAAEAEAPRRPRPGPGPR